MGLKGKWHGKLSASKKNRLSGYDYAEKGTYFITLCVKEREGLLWKEVRNLSEATQITLSEIGTCVERNIVKLDSLYDGVSVDKYCVMYDHVHLLITIDQRENISSVPHIISQFKGCITKECGRSIWQRSYHDHIIRNAEDYQRRWEYIDQNPLKFILDGEW